MRIELNGKLALVTGGSRGIGRAIAERLAASGGRVIVVARRAVELNDAVMAIRDGAPPGAGAWGYPCDVSDAAAIAELHGKVETAHGPIDILVNNAGTSARARFETITDAQWHEDLELKLFSAIRLARLAIPAMRARHWGRIINILSVTGKAPEAGGAPTGVSRAAGLALTKILSRELAPDGILVNAICVGHILSDQWRRFHAEEAPAEAFEDYVKRRGASIPLGRLGEAEEVANIACVLASDQGSYVTGAAINVDGGRSPVL